MSIVISGSVRFIAGIKTFAEKLRQLGIEVYAPVPGPKDWDKMSPQQKDTLGKALVFDHFELIQKAQAVFVYNPEGYVGASVSVELGYATALKKPIYALEPDADTFRRYLYKKITPTPEALAQELDILHKYKNAQGMGRRGGPKNKTPALREGVGGRGYARTLL